MSDLIWKEIVKQSLQELIQENPNLIIDAINTAPNKYTLIQDLIHQMVNNSQYDVNMQAFFIRMNKQIFNDLANSKWIY